jgi:hypothetical protein
MSSTPQAVDQLALQEIMEVLIEGVKEPLSEEAILCPSRPQDDANASFSQSSAACDVPQHGQPPVMQPCHI